MESRIAELESRIAAAEYQSRRRGDGFTPSVSGSDDRLYLLIQCKHPTAFFDDSELLGLLERWDIDKPMLPALRTML